MDDFEERMAGIRDRFYGGVPDRLAAIEEALVTVRAGFDAEAAERFTRAAHSLKGSAASLGDEELADAADVLSAMGKRWMKAGAVEEGDLDRARDGLDVLHAVDRERRGAG